MLVFSPFILPPRWLMGVRRPLTFLADLPPPHLHPIALEIHTYLSPSRGVQWTFMAPSRQPTPSTFSLSHPPHLTPGMDISFHIRPTRPPYPHHIHVLAVCRRLIDLGISHAPVPYPWPTSLSPKPSPLACRPPPVDALPSRLSSMSFHPLLITVWPVSPHRPRSRVTIHTNTIGIPLLPPWRSVAPLRDLPASTALPPSSATATTIPIALALISLSCAAILLTDISCSPSPPLSYASHLMPSLGLADPYPPKHLPSPSKLLEQPRNTEIASQY